MNNTSENLNIHPIAQGPVEAVVVILTRQNEKGVTEFCLAKRKHNIHKDNGEELKASATWNGYGGKREPRDTSILACAVRELEEESGMVAGMDVLIETAQIKFFWPGNNSSTCDMIVTFFLLSNYQGEPRETDKMGEPKFFTFEDAPFDDMMPGDREIFTEIIKRGNVFTADALLIEGTDGKKRCLFKNMYWARRWPLGH